jgi:hypothetical protein
MQILSVASRTLFKGRKETNKRRKDVLEEKEEEEEEHEENKEKEKNCRYNRN